MGESSRNELVERLTPDEGLSFLEHLAHNLTIAVRVAAGDRRPCGPLSDEQSRQAMYWINEALHNVVQLTRDLRLNRETWAADTIQSWLDLWLGYERADGYIESAIRSALAEAFAEERDSGPAHS